MREETADPNEWTEVRVADFYAPELRTPEGKAATVSLDKIVMGKPVECVADWNERTIARCTVQGFVQ